MNAQAEASPAGAWRATCLIVAPPRSRGRCGTVDLLARSLERRGLDVRAARGVYEGMADLLLHARHRGRDGRSHPIVLVLVEPERIRGASLLHEAALRHAPYAVLWEYHAGPPPSLRVFRGCPAEEARTRRVKVKDRPPEAESSPSEQAPPLRLTGDQPEENAPHNKGGAADTEASPRPVEEARPALLTEEELAMLLGGPDGPADSGEGKPR